jgi:hypothetical protein
MRRTSRQKSPLNPIEQPRIRQLRRSQTEKFPQFPPVSKEAWQFSPIIGSAATTRAAARDTAGLGGYPAPVSPRSGDGLALGPPRFDQRSSTCFASLHKLYRRGHRAGREHHGHPSALLQRGTALRSSTFHSARCTEERQGGIDETDRNSRWDALQHSRPPLVQGRRSMFPHVTTYHADEDTDRPLEGFKATIGSLQSVDGFSHR